MPATRLKSFLDENGIKYVTVTHSIAYAAHEVAASAHIPAKDLAKTVIVKVDGRMAMAVLPATHRINLVKLKEVLGVKSVEIAAETEFEDIFPGCVVGAMPPFGNLYDLKVMVAERLTEDEQIAFNAGNHTELIKLDYADFERLVQPTVLKFT